MPKILRRSVLTLITPLVLIVGASWGPWVAPAASQDAQPHFGFYYIRQSCVSDADDKRHIYAFLTRPFYTERYDGIVENEAYAALKAMEETEDVDCHDKSEGQFISAPPWTEEEAAGRRKQIVSYEKSGGVGIVEYNYSDGDDEGDMIGVTSPSTVLD